MDGLPEDTIDSHVHFWDPGRPDWYPYLAPSFDMTSIGVSHGQDVREAYGLEEHLAHTVRAGVRSTVHINATGSPEAFLPEMERVSDLAASPEARGAIGAVQGKVDLTAPTRDIVALLDEYQQFPLFRGVRLLRVADFAAAEVRTVLDWLVAHRHTLDLGVHPHEMAGAVDTLRHYPDLDVVVEHAGWPRPQDLEDDRPWRSGLAALADLGPQVRCKISGLAMALGSTDPDRLRPWVHGPLSLFGSDRCMFASNFPVDQPVGSYEDTVRAYLTLVQETGRRSVVDVFVRTAARFYDIALPRDAGAGATSEAVRR